MIFGIGVGWDKEEFDALGIAFGERGAMTDEYLDIMHELWCAKHPVFEGRYHRFSGAAFEPKPLQQPIPIWVGGYGPAALRRCTRIGAAWHPSEMPPADIARGYKKIALERDPTPAPDLPDVSASYRH